MTIPSIVLGFLVVTPLLPVLVVVTLVGDLLRGRWRLPLVRLLGFGWWYLTAETLGLVVLAASWAATLGRPTARRSQTYRIQRWWAGSLYGALRLLFGFAIELEAEDAKLDAGPYVLMMRHASIADTLVPAIAIAHPFGMRIRYVLKSELLADPCLDVAGNRVPNIFVQRGRAGADIPAVAALATDLGDADAVLIYPEGTRFTAAKRERLMASKRGQVAERAKALTATLPPKPGGPAVLAKAGHDVVFLAHRGLEGLAGIKDLLDGALIGAKVTAEAWRVKAAEVDIDAVDDWLFEQWRRVDAWVAVPAPAE